jgi:hypothetical protein
VARADIVKQGALLATRPGVAPALARTEVLDRATRGRLEAELDAAIKRRPSNERRLAGVVRTLARFSPSLRARMADATDIFLRRGTLDRELFGACIRSLAEARDKALTPLLRRALALESAGGTATLSAACFSTDPTVGPLLAKVAAGHKAHLAFAAEVARVVRGEANGQRLTSLAPMIKESHRLALCAEVFVPLAYRTPAPGAALHTGPALAVLRGAERHLGRWLVLAEVAAAAGDPSPREDVLARASSGPSTARSAWALVLWALDTRLGVTTPIPPSVRPTVEIVSRLSDRPSADHDTTFLFRMARARLASARPMLETLAKDLPLSNEVAVRAAAFLARDHGRADLTAALHEAASPSGKEDLRGVAAGALYDIGDPTTVSEARRISSDLLGSRSLVNVAWGVLIRAAAAHVLAPAADAWSEGVAAETAFRWMQRGWLE